VWAEFTFASKDRPLARYPLQGVTLSAVDLCSKEQTSRVPIGRKIGALHIGSSEAEVLQTMGNPDRIDEAAARERRDPRYATTRYSARYGERVFVYERKQDLGFAFIFLMQGKVNTIWLSVSE
jgi:hypothetical protein